METCLDCEVLPPFSVRLCPLHAAAPAMLRALRDVVETLTEARYFNDNGNTLQTGLEIDTATNAARFGIRRADGDVAP
jgi:hypothetical protein